MEMTREDLLGLAAGFIVLAFILVGFGAFVAYCG